MRNYPATLINAADDSGSVTGSAVFVGQAIAASFTVVCGDTGAAGTVKLQGSNAPPVGDPNVYVPPTASWSDITNATIAVSSGVGPALVLATMNFQYIRAIYTRSGGGTTTISVYMSALGI